MLGARMREKPVSLAVCLALSLPGSPHWWVPACSQRSQGLMGAWGLRKPVRVRSQWALG